MLSWEEGMPCGSRCQRGLPQQLEMWHQGGSGEEHPNLIVFSSLISCLTNPMGQKAKGTDDALQIALQ